MSRQEYRDHSILKGSVFIDLDLTITENRAIDIVGRELGFEEKINHIFSSKKPEYIKSREIASLLKGVSIDLIKSIVYRNIKFKKNVDRFLKGLAERGYEISIVTLTYRQIAEAALEKLYDLYDLEKNLIKQIYAPILVVDPNNIVSGEIIVPPELRNRYKTPFCIECSLCKRFVVRKYGFGRIVSIGDATPDACMFIDSQFSILVKTLSSRRITVLNSSMQISDFERYEEILRSLENF